MQLDSSSPERQKPNLENAFGNLRASESLESQCRLCCANHRPYLADRFLVQCDDCQLVFEHPRPSDQKIRTFYSQSSLWTCSKDAEGKPRSYIQEISEKKIFFKDLAQRIKKHKTAGYLLDIGCGPGLLELELDRSKWKVTGIENASFIADYGRQHLGTSIVNVDFEKSNLPEAHFDVIVMKYVLDHMEKPFEVLKKARKLIKPDGILVLADLINVDSFCARFFKKGHRLFHPMHFTYFSPKTISYHLNRANFKVNRIEFPYWNTCYFTALNIMKLIYRIGERFWNDFFSDGNKPIYSVPFYGSMMDVWASPTEAESKI